MKTAILKLSRFINRYLPMPYKVIFPFLYIMVYTVGFKQTFTIVYRSVKEIKALNLARPKRKASK
jgi:hypothetical protein